MYSYLDKPLTVYNLQIEERALALAFADFWELHPDYKFEAEGWVYFLRHNVRPDSWSADVESRWTARHEVGYLAAEIYSSYQQRPFFT